MAISPLDAVIVGVYLLAVMSVGIWLTRGQKDARDYFLSDRNLPGWAVLGSIVATETSTVTFLSIPGQSAAKNGDFRFLQLACGYVVGRFLVARWLLPCYFRGELATAFQLLDQRFGKSTKTLVSLLFLVARNLADGLRLFLAAIVLEKLSGWSLVNCIALLGITTVIYTVFGGLRSVVWNDCVQLLVYLLGAVIALLVIVRSLPGGWTQLWSFGHAEHKFVIWHPEFDLSAPYTIWSGLLGGIVLTLATHGTDQMMVQRYLGARRQRDATFALVGSGVVVFAQFSLFLLVGVALAAYYSVHPPATELAPRSDEVFPHFIANFMPTGVKGLTLAAVLAAAMSTMSSSLNASAMTLVNDLLPAVRGTAGNSPPDIRVCRAATIAFGVAQIGVGIAGQGFHRSVLDQVLSIAGLTSGVILGVFLLGVGSRRITESAALWGLVGGLLVTFGVTWYTALAWPWYALLSAGSTCLIGTISQWGLSALTRRRSLDRPS